MLENYYITGLPIVLNNMMGTIYQPTIEELVKLDMVNLEIVNPFLILEKSYSQLCNEESFELKCKYDTIPILDLMMLTSRKDSSEKIELLSDKIKKSLSILYKTDIRNIEYMNNIKIGILIKFDDKKKNAFISREDFGLVSDLILEMFCIDKKNLFKDDEDKWVENTGSEREKQLIAYFKEKERKKREKEAYHLCDYINIVQNIDVYVPIDVILKMTYWQLINAYKTKIQFKNYNESLGYAWSFKYQTDMDKMKHWSKEIKIPLSTVK
ncbi:hypothetical protein NQ830_12715 [Clostridioides difficile]|uniref:hypothetical protein n=1 Tax=Clostridioides difficile TaxID=1496 RepID=UPI00038C7D97|nr:hypothetical protein [Clostridioides difficile]EQJ88721.1 hypothetical protein QUC_3229 [Clostridioides difficile P50]MCO8835346.1 hypothetical protein [Clostridioides difficile]MCR1410196.1 hypothetical protein [Clostridioides difficile]MCR1421184.1 hypothetical protein [Clostridioides difficile]MDI0326467.1 hypothetical protein [Clostridioides difficile]